MYSSLILAYFPASLKCTNTSPCCGCDSIKRNNQVIISNRSPPDSRGPRPLIHSGGQCHSGHFIHIIHLELWLCISWLKTAKKTAKTDRFSPKAMTHLTTHENVLMEPGEPDRLVGVLYLNQFYLEELQTLVSQKRGRSRGHFLHWMETDDAQWPFLKGSEKVRVLNKNKY